MNTAENALRDKMFREALEQARQEPRPPLVEKRTIHCTEVSPADPDSPLAAAWETYRREVGRLLKEGNEGRFVLIHRETVIGLHETEEAALQDGYARYWGQPFLVHEIRREEPLLRAPMWFHLWHASRSQSSRTD